jgi:hypothetical protein
MEKEQPAGIAEALKQVVDILQGIATIVAIIVGGIWTYNLFVKEREEYPHAELTHKISNVPLPTNKILLRIAVEVANSGKTQLKIKNALVRVQQILPLSACSSQNECAQSELTTAASSVAQKQDRFSWPLIAERADNLDAPNEIEPGEKQEFDFEFALSSDVREVRVYFYFKNDTLGNGENEYGWYGSDYYNFTPASNSGSTK